MFNCKNEVKMKKNLFVAIAAIVAMTVASSCVKETLEQERCFSSRTVTVSFDGIATRTALDGTSTVWAAGDSVWVSNGTASHSAVVPAEVVGQKVFSFYTNLEGPLYVVYPFAAAAGVAEGKVQVKIPSYQDGAFGHANIAAAKSETTEIHLKNVASILKVTAADGTGILLADAGETPMAGTFAVDLSGEAPALTAVKPSSVLTVKPQDGADAVLYLAVAPGTYASGFTLTAVTAGLGTYGLKTSTQSNEVAVNTLYDLGVVENESGFLEGDGTESSPFIISNLAELTYFAADVADGETYEDKFVKVVADIKGLTVPVGNFGTGATKSFMGDFDGGDHTITLAMDGEYTNKGVGLFASVLPPAKIHNVKTAGFVHTTADVAGGIAAYVNLNAETVPVTFENCTNGASIKGTYNLGGVIGYVYSNKTNNMVVIQDCVNNGEVSGTDRVGGIIGSSIGAATKIVKNCVNNKKISGTKSVAGILGKGLANAVSDCENHGEIVSTDSAGGLYYMNCSKAIPDGGDNGTGGIIGYQQNGSVSKCSNTANITGFNKIGGIIGVEYSCAVSSCTNSGNIKGTGQWNYNVASANGLHYGSAAGGICGWQTCWGNVQDCTNSGDVHGLGGVGGITGHVNGNVTSSAGTLSILRCTNTGKITAEPATSGTGSAVRAGTGGIVGQVWSQASNRYPKVEKCVNKGAVSSNQCQAGGIVGKLYDYNKSKALLVDGCVNEGSVSALFWAGGIAGYLHSRATEGKATIRNCENHGDVLGCRSDDAGEVTGGICGGGNGTNVAGSGLFIYNCFNTGKVMYKVASHVKPYVGGIVGWEQYGTIQNTYNSGYVGPQNGTPADGAENYLGALVGLLSNTSVLSESYYLKTVYTSPVGALGKTAGENVLPTDADGLFEDDPKIGEDFCFTLPDALNAGIKLLPTGVTYLDWTDGPAFIK